MATGKKKGSGNQVILPPTGEMKEFRKTNEAIGLRVTEGRLSLLSRKLFNVMVYHAQQLREPGSFAPISTEAAKKYFWIPLAEVARDAAYESNDTEKLKAHLEELQNIRVHMEDGIQWTSQRLVSAVSLVNPAGLKKRGGQVWFGFAFPPEVQSLVMSPGAYTKLAIYYQTLLRSGASLALYEICRRYLTNPSKVTNRQEWEWWYGAITGNPITEAIPEYKYFKRDIIKPAIAEINLATDINIELIEHTKGRKVIDLQFRVEDAPQASLNFPAPPIIDSELLDRLMVLGISQEEASNYVATHEEAKLKAILAQVESRLTNQSLTKVESPAAYFKHALKNGYVTPQAVAKQTQAKRVAAKDDVETPEELTTRYLAARARDAYELFRELGEDEQNQLLETFKETGRRVKTGAANMGSALFRNEFTHWYAQRLWLDPSPQDLIAFAIEHPRTAVANKK